MEFGYYESPFDTPYYIVEHAHNQSWVQGELFAITGYFDDAQMIVDEVGWDHEHSFTILDENEYLGEGGV